MLGTVAALVVLAAAIALYWASLSFHGPAAYPGDRDRASAEAQGRSAAVAADPCRFPIAGEDSGLRAQWCVADAADRSARSASSQLVLTAFAVAGLLIIAWFNYAAWRRARENEEESDSVLAIAVQNAEAARRAASAAREAAAALREASERSREVREREHRPILAFERIALSRFTELEDKAFLSAVFRNHGRMPAAIVRDEVFRLYSDTIASDDAIEALLAKVPTQLREDSAAIIVPGEVHETPGVMITTDELNVVPSTLPAPEGTGPWESRAHAVIVARVTYKPLVGPEGTTWVSQAAFTFIPRVDENGQIVTTSCLIGNLTRWTKIG